MITLEIVTILGVKLSEEVYEVMVPTEKGIIAVFQNHDDLISKVKPGILSYRRLQDDPEDRLKHLAVQEGMVIVQKNRIRLLVDEALDSDEIVKEEVKEAIEKAKEARRKAKTDADIAFAENLLAQQQVKLKVSDIKRRKREM